jgi:hypothetical protein
MRKADRMILDTEGHEARGQTMNVITYECVVENGCIHLPADAMLPEKSKVYVVVPRMDLPRMARIWSPRLADPSQAPLFKMDVIEEGTDA